MKTNFTIRLLGLFVCSLLLGTSLYAQTTVFYESCGNAGLKTGTRDTPDSYSDWDNAGSVTYSGTVDVRATNNINTHVWFAAERDRYFTISGIHTAGYNDLRLSFELAANASGGNANNMSIKVRDMASGAESNLTVPSVSIGSQNSYVSVENIAGISATSNLEITFSFTETTNTVGYRLDDILITSGALEGSNNNLAGLSVSNGVLNPAFSAQTTIYSVELPEGTTEIPQVMYTLEDPEATVVVTNATEIPGSTLIKVTAVNGSEKVYTINFILQTPAGAWLETFEGNADNKGSYQSAEFEGVAAIWNVYGVITSTDDNDKKNGSRSVRLRDPNASNAEPHYVEMITDKPNGAGVISLYHGMYGTHTGGAWKIEVSNDGGYT
ncbi:MAG: hypothetical protein LUG18_01075 [Candidatus Azobacteroides sp.]|nr:hypothetical protein [Candidatus Azobacteroides sp.]